MILKLVNAKDTGTPVTLEFNPDIVRIDLSSESYLDKVQGSEATNSNGYIKKFTFNMSRESTKYIKFYKVDMSKDYTYPSGNTESIITVKNN